MRSSLLSIARTPRIDLKSALFVAALPLLTYGCGAGTAADAGYKTVEVSYAYDAQNQETRKWRALMTALDKCHAGGFNNAAPAKPPDLICTVTKADICTTYHVIQVYDCYGMGN